MEEKKLTRRRQQAIDTKNRIFEVTMQLGSEIGYESLDISSICKAANISVGTFYHYFRSLDAVFQEQYYQYDSFIAKSIQDSPLLGSATERLWQLFSLKYRYVVAHGVQSIVRQYRGQFAQVDSENSIFYSEERITVKALISILEEGIANGEFVMGDSPKFVANVLLVFSRGILVDWALKNGSYDLEKVALQNLNLIMRQYIVDPGSSGTPLSQQPRPS
ncbi:MAG: TetR/AcrR family transcriptional regulator [Oscillospiraceae bacterium]|nr:TetR/AcrR family transcriptional regulator [Oscillospiraceae bacterium]